MIAQWDSSLSVLPVARVMIAQWNSSLSVLPVAWVQFPATTEYFKGFSLADHTLPTRPEPAWQEMAQSPSMTQHNLRTTRRKAEVQPCIDDSWKKKTKYYTKLILIFGLVLCTEAPVMHIES